MRASLAFLVLVACAADKPRPAGPTPPDPAPAAAAVPSVASAPPQPVDATPTPPPAPVVAGPCDERRLQVAVTRATGEGSFILRLSCAGTTFAVSSDRARPTGEELTAVFKVSPLDWEKAYRTIEDLKWRVFDDACGPNETRIGMSPGPVYRVEIQDTVDRRSFHCAGVRSFTEPLDQLHARLLAMAPPTPPSLPGAGDRTGVPQCDAFLDKYMRCIAEKVPAAERPDFEQALADTRVRLRDALVADPSAGPALVKTCDRLQDEARKGTAKYRCRF
jgi:hypothetical protein